MNFTKKVGVIKEGQTLKQIMQF